MFRNRLLFLSSAPVTSNLLRSLVVRPYVRSMHLHSPFSPPALFTSQCHIFFLILYCWALSAAHVQVVGHEQRSTPKNTKVFFCTCSALASCTPACFCRNFFRTPDDSALSVHIVLVCVARISPSPSPAAVRSTCFSLEWCDSVRSVCRYPATLPTFMW